MILPLVLASVMALIYILTALYMSVEVNTGIHQDLRIRAEKESGRKDGETVSEERTKRHRGSSLLRFGRTRTESARRYVVREADFIRKTDFLKGG